MSKSKLRKVSEYGTTVPYSLSMDAHLGHKGNDPDTPLGVQGGHRAGKRHKGTSLLKRKPRSTVHTYVRDLLDSKTGEVVQANVRTMTYVRPMPKTRDYRRTSL